MLFHAIGGTLGGTLLLFALVSPIAAQTLQESEPNDAFAAANPIALGDTVAGRSDASFDADYFVFAASGGTPIELDIDARVDGSAMDAMVSLFDSAGTRLAFNDDFDGRDSRLHFTLPYTGSYYVLVEDWADAGGIDFFYRLNAGARPTGPGDPPVRWPEGPPVGWLASGPGGTYAGSSSGVWKLELSGNYTAVPVPTSAYANTPFHVVIDGFGDLLFVRGDRIDRVSVTGGAVEALGQGTVALAAVVAADGYIWWTSSAEALYRMDPFGHTSEVIDAVVGHYPSQMAFSPDGVLHLVTGFGTLVRRDPAGGWIVVYSGAEGSWLSDLAFDERGHVFLYDEGHNRIVELDAAYNVVADPLATTQLEAGRDLEWLSDANGVATSRLVAASAGIVEVAPAAFAAPGATIVPKLIAADAPSSAALMGTPYMHEMTPRLSGSTWRVMLGEMPAGLELSTDGIIAGVPAESGEFDFVVRVDTDQTWGGVRVRMNIARPSPTTTAAADALLNPGALDENTARFLDLQGNGNGTYDVADFHAYVRTSLELSTERSDAEVRP